MIAARHRFRLPRAAVFGLLVAGIGAAAPALSCGYDGVAMDGPSEPWRSTPVGAAVLVAVEDDLVDPRDVEVRPGDMFAYHRVVAELGHLRAALARAAGAQPGPPFTFSVLLVESGLRSRFVIAGGSVAMAAHVTADPAEAVVSTAHAVIAAIAAGRLTADDARRQGLIEVNAPHDVSLRLDHLLDAALRDLAGKAGL